MRFSKTIVVCLFALSLFLVSTNYPLAQTPTTISPEPAVPAIKITDEKVNPSNGFAYLQKRLGEKIKLSFLSLFAGKKENFYEEMVNRRLAELKYVIEKPDMNNFEHATTRYSTTVGYWVEYIEKKKLNDQKQPAADMLLSHIPVMEQLMAKYDPTTAEWRFIKHDLDYLNIYISKMKK